MRIAICDDEKIVSKELSMLIEKFNKENQITNDLVFFSKPSDLYDYMQEYPVEIIFMDLEFCNSSEDGIVWSKTIRKKFPQTIIIILTAYERRYKEGFEARVFRFMTKPILEKELFDNLQVSMEELQLTKTISLQRRGIEQNIRVKDIYYFSAQAGGSEIWTGSDMYYCEESLLQWEQKLPVDVFFRCHHKYLVNLTYVTGFDHQVLTLINGEKIPVSRRKWKAFQIAYMKCDTRDYRL